jgi:hypothetical protein
MEFVDLPRRVQSRNEYFDPSRCRYRLSRYISIEWLYGERRFQDEEFSADFLNAPGSMEGWLTPLP